MSGNVYCAFDCEPLGFEHGMSRVKPHQLRQEAGAGCEREVGGLG